MNQRFLRCSHCGNIVAIVEDKGVPVMCCGQKMEQLIPGAIEASKEKHFPVFAIDNNKVYVVVGDTEHPMTADHYIQWISIQTKFGNQRKCLAPSDKPVACFSICDGDEVQAVYAYCNLHGLWMAESGIAFACDLPPVNTDTNENYVICKCNNVTYFDIINAAQNSETLDNLLALFENVKNTTHCSTGCGGCYGKVITVISDVINGKIS